MAEFFKSQMDYIFFFYGVSFFLLLPICHYLNRRPKKRLPWMWLGLFGVAHGLHEWVDLLTLDLLRSPLLNLTSLGLIVASFVFLMEFGRSSTLALRGRAPGRWIIVAFLGLAALGGFAGVSGLCAISRYTLGVAGALWTAGVFYFASKKAWPGKLTLLGAALGMFGYALANGLVISPASFFPTSLFNSATFFNATGLPIQLVRGLLILWITACLCLFAQASLTQEAESRIRVWGRTLMSGAAVAVIVLLVLGSFITKYFGDEATQALRSNQESHAKVLIRMMVDSMGEADHLAKTMAASPWIAPALEHRDAHTLEFANSVLDRYSLALAGSVCYLMDFNGLTIASSNRHQADSFVDQNFKFRPYFKNAMKGMPGRYWALGVTSKELGYYASYPVRGRAGKIVGVAVLKRPIGDLGAFFPPQSLGFVLDSHGIVVMTNEPKMVMKSLWPLSSETREHLLASRQFGLGPFAPILSREPVDRGEYQLEGNRQIALRWPFPWEDWSVFILMPLKPIIVGRLEGMGVTLLVCLGVIGFLAIIGMTIDSTARIQSSEKRYHILYDSLREGSATMNLEGTFVEFNPAFREMLGYSPDEIYRLTSKDITPASWHSMEARIIEEQVILNGYSDPYEKEYRRKDGSIFPVELRTYFIHDEGSKPAGMTIFVRDITARKRAEQALLESEQKYRELVTTVPAMVFKGYADWGVDFFDDKIEELTGYPLQDFTSRKLKWSELIWPEDLERSKEIFKRALKTDKSYLREYRITGRLGTPHWIRERGQIVCHSNGKINYVSGVFSDITSEHEIELALKKSEERYRLVFENAPAGIMQYDKSGIVTDCNEKFAKIIGAPKEKLIGFNMLRELKDGRFREAVAASLNGQCGFYEGDYLSVLGNKLTPVRAIFQEILSPEDDLVGGVGILEDITIRRQAEEELNKSLSLLHATLESTADGILVVGLDGRVVSYNHKFLELWHVPKEIIAPGDDGQALAYVLDQLTNPEAFLKRVKEIYEQPEAETFDILKFKDGRFFERYSKPQRLGENVVGRVWSFRDISERIKAETDLERLRLQHEMILNSAGEGVIGLDLMGNVTFINPAALSLSGYKKNELFGRNMHKILQYQKADGIPSQEEECPICRTLADGVGRRTSDDVFWTKEGKPLPVEFVTSPLAGNGRLAGAVVVFRDIAERKQWEEDLKKANTHLQVLVSESEERNRHMTLLHEMSDVLQACQTSEEAYNSTAHFASKFFSGYGGGLYMLNNSKNLFEKVAAWGTSLLESVFVPDECWALRLGREHFVDDSTSGLMCQHVSSQIHAGYMCIPMMAQGEAISILHLQRIPSEGANHVEAAAPLASTVAEGVALSLANLKLRETLRSQAIRDDLTGLFNRRYMEETLERELHRVTRLNIPLGLAMLDLDHFKRYNDNFGHHAGDELLRTLGRLIRSQTREEDIACRYGGEEFLIIMPGASREVTLERTEQMRLCIKQLHDLSPNQFLHPITISIGLGIFPDNGSTGEALIQAADVALYLAKKEGRDRVVAAA